MKTVVAIWKQIEAALDVDGRRRLRPPVTARTQTALERTLGRPLPRDLAASLQVHDGTRAGAPLWSNEQFLGAQAISRRARMMSGLVRRRDFGADHWNPSWIPLTDADGDGYCFDGRRVIRFSNSGGKAKVVAASIAEWLATIPGRIVAEARAEQKTATLLAAPEAERLNKRERERRERIDRELPLLVAYVDDFANWANGPATRERVLRFHPIARLPPVEILARALERGFLNDQRGIVAVTPAGRKLRR